MTIPRSRQIDVTVTPYYHCIARCVRRAYLCGEDALTGRSFEHRRGWIVKKLKMLCQLFAIDICAYAVMSNHYHVVLKVDVARAKAWTMDEVIEKWSRLFNGNILVNKYRNKEQLTEAELIYVTHTAETWRSNLTSISWFMRCMNETIARQANQEDDCKGRFWEGRFKSQALLDMEALISCMAYVDLNPIRAGICEDLKEADFTSIQERLKAIAKLQQQDNHIAEQQPASLLPFSETESAQLSNAIPMSLTSYISLVEATGRAIRADKPGYIPESVIPILRQLGVNPYGFIEVIKDYTCLFPSASGTIQQLRRFNAHFNKKWSKDLQGSKLLYSKVS